MEIFYQEEAFHTEQKSGKMTLPPQKNFPVTPLPLLVPFISIDYLEHKRNKFMLPTSDTEKGITIQLIICQPYSFVMGKRLVPVGT